MKGVIAFFLVEDMIRKQFKTLRMQLHYILEMLLAKNNIRLHTDEIKLQVSSHPSYPSLHALTDVLQHFGVPNLAIKLPTTEEILDELPSFFIAHVTRSNKEDLVLIEKLKNKINITVDKNKSEQISKESFLELWDGIIVAIEKDNHIIEQPISPIKNALKWFLISLGLLAIGYFTMTLNDTFAQFHFLLSIIGLIFSVLIVRQELGMQSSIVNNFCNLSANTSCEASLTSKGAKIFDTYKLSTICIITFSTYLLYWLLFYNNGVFSYSALSITTLIALPFTFFSLYYQNYIVKKWCPLCLGIVAVLWLQTGSLIESTSLLLIESYDWFSYFFLLISFIISIGCWNFINPYIERKIRLDKIEVDHLKFIRNYSLFKTLHQKGKLLSTPAIPIHGEIVLGNKNAPLNLVLVTSPLCFYCKQTHSDLIQILQIANNKVKITLRFNVDINKKEGLSYQITAQLLHIFNTQEIEVSQKVLHEVFGENVDHKKWLANNRDDKNANYDSILLTQHDWCLENGINFTPALFVHGKQFPKDYERTDLIYFIDDLIEQQEANKSLNGSLVVNG